MHRVMFLSRLSLPPSSIVQLMNGSWDPIHLEGVETFPNNREINTNKQGAGAVHDTN